MKLDKLFLLGSALLLGCCCCLFAVALAQDDSQNGKMDEETSLIPGTYKFEKDDGNFDALLKQQGKFTSFSGP